ncbi:hypothetical protein [Streptomyces sp. NPDC088674]|uniref:hypothetical protein n=1 Tax=Streptomyces sp. NPDC088674 TaxID=3365869 RepID=UPI003813D320
MLAANPLLMLPLFTIISPTENTSNGFRAKAAGRGITLLGFLSALATGITGVGILPRHTQNDARSTTILAHPSPCRCRRPGSGALGNRLSIGGSPRLILPTVTAAVLCAGIKAAAITPWHPQVRLATALAAARSVARR